MSAISITAVREAPDQGGLVGSRIDSPDGDTQIEALSLPIRGWVIGKDVPVTRVRLSQSGRPLREVPVSVHRADVARQFPEIMDVEWCGFGLHLNALELDQRFAVELEAVFEDGRAAPVGAIEGERRLVRPSDQQGMQPVMVTTIGRSGSKWLTWLLSCHPEVVAYRPLVFEPRVTTYWMAVLRSLSAPQSYLRQLHSANWQLRWWLGEGEAPLPAPVEDEVGAWLGSDAIDDLVRMARDRTVALYGAIATREGREPRYFVEKFLLDPVVLNLVSEVFADAREVILVRDFRDCLSSVLAWDAHRGDHGFGREPGMNDDEYVTRKVLQDARSLVERWHTRGDRAHLVRYEDLVLEPEPTLAGILSYLGLPADPVIVRAMLGQAAEAGELLDAHRTVSDPAESVGRWRRDLPDGLAELASDVLAPVLREFGYATDATVSSHP